MDTRWKGLVVCLILIVLVVGYIFLRPWRSSGPPFPTNSDRVSVDELVEKYAPGSIILPTWMPDDLILVEIFYIGTAILIYGSEDLVIEETEDVYDGRVWIEITPTYSQNQIQGAIIQAGSKGEVIGNLSVVIYEDASPGPQWRKRWMKPIIARFYRDDFQYLITARKGKTSREELIRIIENMKPVEPQTMRKHG